MFGTPLVSKIAFLIFGGFLSYFVPYETCNMLKQAGKPVFGKLISSLILLTFLAGYAAFFYYNHETVFSAILIAVYLIIFLFLALPWLFLLFIIGKEGARPDIIFEQL